MRTAPSSARVTVGAEQALEERGRRCSEESSFSFAFPLALALFFGAESSEMESAGPARGEERNVCDFGRCLIAGSTSVEGPTLREREKSAEKGLASVVDIS